MLVFLGLLINTSQNLESPAPAGVMGRIRTAAWRVFGAFVLSMVSVSLSLVWLAVPGGDCLYLASVLVFAADIAAIVVIAALTTKRLLS